MNKNHLVNKQNSFVGISTKIYTEDKHTVQLGWNRKHGKMFQHFENCGNGVIYVSYSSEGHPNKEFKQKWEFGNHISQQDALYELEVKNTISPICEAIKDFLHTPKT